MSDEFLCPTCQHKQPQEFYVAGVLTGTVEGRFLELLVYAGGVRRVLELGTYSGYSSLSMAAGLPAGARTF